MSAHCSVRGHPATLHGTFALEGTVWRPKDGDWTYDDTGEPVGKGDRPCARCGRPPTPEGYDACLGHVPGAISACCGHGVQESYVMRGAA